MRLISVSSTGGSISITAGSSSHHDIHGFSVNLLESQPARLRFRSVQFGSVTVVSLLLGEVDHVIDDAATNASRNEEDVYILVGSDEGLTETTLLRIAALINEISIFLRITPKSQGNLYILRMVLQYVDVRLSMFDLSFLTQSMDAVFNPAITATGYTSNARLFDELVRSNIYEDRLDTERMPGYASVLFGHKVLMETTVDIADDAAKANDIEKFTFNDADRYLIYLICTAFFAVPHPHANRAQTERESRLMELERTLQKFEIHRHNASRKAAHDLVAEYCAMLRSPDVNDAARAEYYEQALQELCEMSGSGALERNVAHKNRYHGDTLDFDFLESQVFVIHNCCFRNSDYYGIVQLMWAPSPAPAAEEWSISDLCPNGYSLCVVYFPPRNEKEAVKLENDFHTLVPLDPLRGLSHDVLGGVEMSFNRFQWLLSPPVESYETPGLIHFIAVDRRDNSCVYGSFERMMHQKPAELCAAVVELQRTMMQCISKAHQLLSFGFSEGLWGHLGMQFFYSVGVAPDSSNQPPQKTQDVAAAGLFGASDTRKLPTSILQHLVLRPILIPDFIDDVKQTRVVEIYCMFVGCMSPQEICQSVEWLRSSRLFS